MIDKEMKDVFEELNPTPSQTDKMWERLSQPNPKPVKIGKGTHHALRYAVMALLAVVAISVPGFAINAAANGKLFSAIQALIGISTDSHEIIREAEKVELNGIETYASDILYLDGSLLIFGNLRGIIIYDLKQEEVIGTIDIQQIGCIYFDSYLKQTYVVVDGNGLVIYNEEDGKPFGSYYKYEIAKGKETLLTPTEIGNDPALFEKYDKLWRAQKEREVDTFDLFCNHDDVADYFQNDKEASMLYSEKSKCWEDSNGGKNISFLAVEAGSYYLYTYREDTKGIVAKKILLSGNEAQEGISETNGREETANGGMENEAESNVEKDSAEPSPSQDSLPPFVYTGEDKAIEAICNYFLSGEGSQNISLAEQEVWIPSFVILKEEERGDEYLVFGKFYSETYLQIGVILESRGSGERPACFHLVKEGDGYRVASVDRARDGAYYAADIKKFTEDYDGLYEKYMNHELLEQQKEVARREYLQMYINHNNLDIQYVKDYGWDPQKIFDE